MNCLSCGTIGRSSSNSYSTSICARGALLMPERMPRNADACGVRSRNGDHVFALSRWFRDRLKPAPTNLATCSSVVGDAVSQLVDPEPLDLRFKRRRGYSQSRGRAGRAGHTPPSFRQCLLDHLLLAGLERGVQAGRHFHARSFFDHQLERERQHRAVAQDGAVLDDVLQLVFTRSPVNADESPVNADERPAR